MILEELPWKTKSLSVINFGASGHRASPYLFSRAAHADLILARNYLLSQTVAVLYNTYQMSAGFGHLTLYNQSLL